MPGSENLEKFYDLPNREKEINMEIPSEVNRVMNKLEESGFEAYIVGGCVRDFLRDIKPKDWDITTNAKPEEIQKIFPENFYENNFGTVTVITKSEDQTLKTIEITPYRIEGKYTDKRHPDEIKFAKTLKEDLSRRDFTVNAMAFDGKKIVDPFGGQKDLEEGTIRAVGKPQERFSEDALRILRAIRFANQLDFEIEPKTLEAIKKEGHLLAVISKERIRDEFLKIVDHTPKEWLAGEGKENKVAEEEINEIVKEDYEKGPAKVFELMRQAGILKHIFPEIEDGYSVTQNKHHTYTVWEHNLRSFAYAVRKNYPREVRLAALLHDVGKPKTKRGEGPDSTFYNHEMESVKIAIRALNRLRFPKKDIEKISKLVRFHMFKSDVEEITDSAVRRLVRNVDPENIWDLIKVRICDRIGSGRPKAEPFRLREYYVMVDKALREPISLKQLKINGDKLMNILDIKPGPKIGFILNALMNEILDDPEKNKDDYLEKRAKKLNEMSDDELKNFADEAKRKMEKIEYRNEQVTKKKYWV